MSFILNGSARAPRGPRDLWGSEGSDGSFQSQLPALWNVPQIHQNATGWEKSQERGCASQNTLFGVVFTEQSWSSFAPVSDSENGSFPRSPHSPGQAVSPLGVGNNLPPPRWDSLGKSEGT